MAVANRRHGNAADMERNLALNAERAPAFMEKPVQP